MLRIMGIVLATPVPMSATVWGLLAALSVMLIEAVRVPIAFGVKVTEIMQLEPTTTEFPQVLVLKA